MYLTCMRPPSYLPTPTHNPLCTVGRVVKLPHLYVSDRLSSEAAVLYSCEGRGDNEKCDGSVIK